MSALTAVIEVLRFLCQCTGACVLEIYRRRRRPHLLLLAALAVCALLVWTTMRAASNELVVDSPSQEPASYETPPSRGPGAGKATADTLHDGGCLLYTSDAADE